MHGLNDSSENTTMLYKHRNEATQQTRFNTLAAYLLSFCKQNNAFNYLYVLCVRTHNGLTKIKKEAFLEEKSQKHLE